MIATLYNFDELNHDAQARVIDEYREVNVENDYWYECIVSDFEDIGVTINDFDMYKGKVDLEFYLSIREVADLAIEACITTTLRSSAINFLEAARSEDNEVDFYLDLKEEILNVLRDHHRQLTSDDEVAYTIANSDLLFDKDGGTDI